MAGPFLNVYNAPTLKLLADQGTRCRVVLPEVNGNCLDQRMACPYLSYVLPDQGNPCYDNLA